MRTFIRCAAIAALAFTNVEAVAASGEAKEDNGQVKVASETSKEKFSYIPNVHGTVRARGEVSTDDGEWRFQVRNARLSLDGRIAPRLSYFFNTDFCDCGTIKILDVYAKMEVFDGFSFQAGQFRMPFGIEPFRAPHNYIFANRSFMGKQVCNVRAVGAKASYKLPKLPLLVEAGIFNPTAIGDHTGWHKRPAWSATASYTVDKVKFTTGFQSTVKGTTRVNIVDGAIGWHTDRWTVEGEYMNEHYVGSDFKNCHSYCVFGDYRMPIKAGIFNRLSFQGRFDGMTDNSNGSFNDQHQLYANYPSRNRVTIGSTITYARTASMFFDVRLNYEKYFYHSGVTVSAADGDKALLELVLRF